MPFRGFAWRHDGGFGFDLQLDVERPNVDLRQRTAETFVVLRSFCYVVPDRDPDRGKVYVVPGADGPRDANGEPIPWRDTKTATWNGRQVVIPPNPCCGETDLASVPWFMWWLVATYGNHTRAALLHDALVVDKHTPPIAPPIARTAADRLFLTALREPQERKGAFRHWLMWAAVATFGTMGTLRAILFATHVLAFWALLVGAVALTWGETIWAWGPSGWFDDPPGPDWLWHLAYAAVLAAALFLAVAVALWALGGAWRVGVDNDKGWLAPIAASVALVLIALGLEWIEEPVVDSGTWLLLASLAALALGPLWGRAVDRSLRGWLWPTALIGLPIALLPVGLIFASIYLVGSIEKGAERVRALRAGETYEEPSVKPEHFPPM